VLNEEERRIQYTTIKEWIGRNKQDLLKQGIRADETHGSGVALVAENNSRQSHQRQGKWSGRHSDNHSSRGGSSVINPPIIITTGTVKQLARTIRGSCHADTATSSVRTELFRLHI